MDARSSGGPEVVVEPTINGNAPLSRTPLLLAHMLPEGPLQLYFDRPQTSIVAFTVNPDGTIAVPTAESSYRRLTMTSGMPVLTVLAPPP